MRFLDSLRPCSLALAILLPMAISLPIAAQTAETQQPAKDQPAKEQPAKEAVDAKSRQWWNQARQINLLALTAEQRKAMDTRLDAYLEQEHAVTRPLQKELATALGAGEWATAQAKAEALNDARNQAFKDQVDLKIDILKLLEPTQRQELAKSFPQLLVAPWVRTREGGQGKGAGKGAGKGQQRRERG